jgi:hypothetical protein
MNKKLRFHHSLCPGGDVVAEIAAAMNKKLRFHHSLRPRRAWGFIR